MKVKAFDVSACKEQTAILCYSGSSQPSHYSDVMVALHCYKTYGIPEKNFFGFVPHQWHSRLAQAYPAAKFSSFADLASGTASLNFKYVIAVVTGHGSVDGISFSSPGTEDVGGVIRCHEFYETIKAVQRVELVIPVFGQCYAGLFNHISALGTPTLCPVGATCLHSSLNSHVPGVGFLNVFLCYFHEWFIKPIDVNGDKKTSLLDCFQYAGTRTNNLILQSRSTWYRDLRNLEEILRNPHLEDAQRQGVVDRIKERLEALYTVQEPWILNANQFRDVLF